jgi:hypothetical protein
LRQAPATSTIEDPRGFVAALAQSIHSEAVAAMPVGEVLTTGRVAIQNIVRVKNVTGCLLTFRFYRSLFIASLA